MAQLLGKIIFAIVATVLISVVLTFAMGVVGTLFGLVVLAIKVALFVGLIYLVWMVIRKLTQTAA